MDSSLGWECWNAEGAQKYREGCTASSSSSSSGTLGVPLDVWSSLSTWSFYRRHALRRSPLHYYDYFFSSKKVNSVQKSICPRHHRQHRCCRFSPHETTLVGGTFNFSNNNFLRTLTERDHIKNNKTEKKESKSWKEERKSKRKKVEENGGNPFSPPSFSSDFCPSFSCSFSPPPCHHSNLSTRGDGVSLTLNHYFHQKKDFAANTESSDHSHCNSAPLHYSVKFSSSSSLESITETCVNDHHHRSPPARCTLNTSNASNTSTPIAEKKRRNGRRSKRERRMLKRKWPQPHINCKKEEEDDMMVYMEEGGDEEGTILRSTFSLPSVKIVCSIVAASQLHKGSGAGVGEVKTTMKSTTSAVNRFFSTSSSTTTNSPSPPPPPPPTTTSSSDTAAVLPPISSTALRACLLECVHEIKSSLKTSLRSSILFPNLPSLLAPRSSGAAGGSSAYLFSSCTGAGTSTTGNSSPLRASMVDPSSPVWARPYPASRSLPPPPSAPPPPTSTSNLSPSFRTPYGIQHQRSVTTSAFDALSSAKKGMIDPPEVWQNTSERTTSNTSSSGDADNTNKMEQLTPPSGRRCNEVEVSSLSRAGGAAKGTREGMRIENTNTSSWVNPENNFPGGHPLPLASLSRVGSLSPNPDEPRLGSSLPLVSSSSLGIEKSTPTNQDEPRTGARVEIKGEGDSKNFPLTHGRMPSSSTSTTTGRKGGKRDAQKHAGRSKDGIVFSNSCAHAEQIPTNNDGRNGTQTKEFGHNTATNIATTSSSSGYRPPSSSHSFPPLSFPSDSDPFINVEVEAQWPSVVRGSGSGAGGAATVGGVSGDSLGLFASSSAVGESWKGSHGSRLAPGPSLHHPREQPSSSFQRGRGTSSSTSSEDTGAPQRHRRGSAASVMSSISTTPTFTMVGNDGGGASLRRVGSFAALPSSPSSSLQGRRASVDNPQNVVSSHPVLTPSSVLRGATEGPHHSPIAPATTSTPTSSGISAADGGCPHHHVPPFSLISPSSMPFLHVLIIYIDDALPESAKAALLASTTLSRTSGGAQAITATTTSFSTERTPTTSFAKLTPEVNTSSGPQQGKLKNMTSPRAGSESPLFSSYFSFKGFSGGRKEGKGAGVAAASSAPRSTTTTPTTSTSSKTTNLSLPHPLAPAQPPVSSYTIIHPTSTSSTSALSSSLPPFAQFIYDWEKQIENQYQKVLSSGLASLSEAGAPSTSGGRSSAPASPFLSPSLGNNLRAQTDLHNLNDRKSIRPGGIGGKEGKVVANITCGTSTATASTSDGGVEWRQHAEEVEKARRWYSTLYLLYHPALAALQRETQATLDGEEEKEKKEEAERKGRKWRKEEGELAGQSSGLPFCKAEKHSTANLSVGVFSSSSSFISTSMKHERLSPLPTCPDNHNGANPIHENGNNEEGEKGRVENRQYGRHGSDKELSPSSCALSLPKNTPPLPPRLLPATSSPPSVLSSLNPVEESPSERKASRRGLNQSSLSLSPPSPFQKENASYKGSDDNNRSTGGHNDESESVLFALSEIPCSSPLPSFYQPAPPPSPPSRRQEDLNPSSSSSPSPRSSPPLHSIPSVESVMQVQAYAEVLQRLVNSLSLSRPPSVGTYTPQGALLLVIHALQQVSTSRAKAVVSRWEDYDRQRLLLQRRGGIIEGKGPLPKSVEDALERKWNIPPVADSLSEEGVVAVEDEKEREGYEEEEEAHRRRGREKRRGVQSGTGAFFGQKGDDEVASDGEGNDEEEELQRRAARYSLSPYRHWSLLHFWRLGYDVIQFALQFSHVPVALHWLEFLFKFYYIHSDDYILVHYGKPFTAAYWPWRRRRRGKPCRVGMKRSEEKLVRPSKMNHGENHQSQDLPSHGAGVSSFQQAVSCQRGSVPFSTTTIISSSPTSSSVVSSTASSPLTSYVVPRAPIHSNISASRISSTAPSSSASSRSSSFSFSTPCSTFSSLCSSSLPHPPRRQQRLASSSQVPPLLVQLGRLRHLLDPRLFQRCRPVLPSTCALPDPNPNTDRLSSGAWDNNSDPNTRRHRGYKIPIRRRSSVILTVGNKDDDDGGPSNNGHNNNSTSGGVRDEKGASGGAADDTFFPSSLGEGHGGGGKGRIRRPSLLSGGSTALLFNSNFNRLTPSGMYGSHYPVAFSPGVEILLGVIFLSSLEVLCSALLRRRQEKTLRQMCLHFAQQKQRRREEDQERERQQQQEHLQQYPCDLDSPKGDEFRELCAQRNFRREKGDKRIKPENHLSLRNTDHYDNERKSILLVQGQEEEYRNISVIPPLRGGQEEANKHERETERGSDGTSRERSFPELALSPSLLESPHKGENWFSLAPPISLLPVDDEDHYNFRMEEEEKVRLAEQIMIEEKRREIRLHESEAVQRINARLKCVAEILKENELATIEVMEQQKKQEHQDEEKPVLLLQKRVQNKKERTETSSGVSLCHSNKSDEERKRTTMQEGGHANEWKGERKGKKNDPLLSSTSLWNSQSRDGRRFQHHLFLLQLYCSGLRVLWSQMGVPEELTSRGLTSPDDLFFTPSCSSSSSSSLSSSRGLVGDAIQDEEEEHQRTVSPHHSRDCTARKDRKRPAAYTSGVGMLSNLLHSQHASASPLFSACRAPPRDWYVSAAFRTATAGATPSSACALKDRNCSSSGGGIHSYQIVTPRPCLPFYFCFSAPPSSLGSSFCSCLSPRTSWKWITEQARMWGLATTAVKREKERITEMAVVTPLPPSHRHRRRNPCLLCPPDSDVKRQRRQRNHEPNEEEDDGECPDGFSSVSSSCSCRSTSSSSSRFSSTTSSSSCSCSSSSPDAYPDYKRDFPSCPSYQMRIKLQEQQQRERKLQNQKEWELLSQVLMSARKSLMVVYQSLAMDEWKKNKKKEKNQRKEEEAASSLLSSRSSEKERPEHRKESQTLLEQEDGVDENNSGGNHADTTDDNRDLVRPCEENEEKMDVKGMEKIAGRGAATLAPASSSSSFFFFPCGIMPPAGEGQNLSSRRRGSSEWVCAAANLENAVELWVGFTVMTAEFLVLSHQPRCAFGLYTRLTLLLLLLLRWKGQSKGKSVQNEKRNQKEGKEVEKEDVEGDDNEEGPHEKKGFPSALQYGRLALHVVYYRLLPLLRLCLSRGYSSASPPFALSLLASAKSARNLDYSPPFPLSHDYYLHQEEGGRHAPISPNGHAWRMALAEFSMKLLLECLFAVCSCFPSRSFSPISSLYHKEESEDDGKDLVKQQQHYHPSPPLGFHHPDRQRKTSKVRFPLLRNGWSGEDVFQFLFGSPSSVSYRNDVSLSFRENVSAFPFLSRVLHSSKGDNVPEGSTDTTSGEKQPRRPFSRPTSRTPSPTTSPPPATTTSSSSLDLYYQCREVVLRWLQQLPPSSSSSIPTERGKWKKEPIKNDKQKKEKKKKAKEVTVIVGSEKEQKKERNGLHSSFLFSALFGEKPFLSSPTSIHRGNASSYCPIWKVEDHPGIIPTFSRSDSSFSSTLLPPHQQPFPSLPSSRRWGIQLLFTMDEAATSAVAAASLRTTGGSGRSGTSKSNKINRGNNSSPALLSIKIPSWGFSIKKKMVAPPPAVGVTGEIGRENCPANLPHDNKETARDTSSFSSSSVGLTLPLPALPLSLIWECFYIKARNITPKPDPPPSPPSSSPSASSLVSCMSSLPPPPSSTSLSQRRKSNALATFSFPVSIADTEKMMKKKKEEEEEEEQKEEEHDANDLLVFHLHKSNHSLFSRRRRRSSLAAGSVHANRDVSEDTVGGEKRKVIQINVNATCFTELWESEERLSSSSTVTLPSSSSSSSSAMGEGGTGKGGAEVLDCFGSPSWLEVKLTLGIQMKDEEEEKEDSEEGTAKLAPVEGSALNPPENHGHHMRDDRDFRPGSTTQHKKKEFGAVHFHYMYPLSALPSHSSSASTTASWASAGSGTVMVVPPTPSSTAIATLAQNTKNRTKKQRTRQKEAVHSPSLSRTVTRNTPLLSPPPSSSSSITTCSAPSTLTYDALTKKMNISFTFGISPAEKATSLSTSTSVYLASSTTSPTTRASTRRRRSEGREIKSPKGKENGAVREEEEKKKANMKMGKVKPSAMTARCIDSSDEAALACGIGGENEAEAKAMPSTRVTTSNCRSTLPPSPLSSSPHASSPTTKARPFSSSRCSYPFVPLLDGAYFLQSISLSRHSTVSVHKGNSTACSRSPLHTSWLPSKLPFSTQEMKANQRVKKGEEEEGDGEKEKENKRQQVTRHSSAPCCCHRQCRYGCENHADSVDKNNNTTSTIGEAYYPVVAVTAFEYVCSSLPPPLSPSSSSSLSFPFPPITSASPFPFFRPRWMFAVRSSSSLVQRLTLNVSLPCQNVCLKVEKRKKILKNSVAATSHPFSCTEGKEEKEEEEEEHHSKVVPLPIFSSASACTSSPPCAVFPAWMPLFPCQACSPSHCPPFSSSPSSLLVPYFQFNVHFATLLGKECNVSDIPPLLALISSSFLKKCASERRSIIVQRSTSSSSSFSSDEETERNCDTVDKKNREESIRTQEGRNRLEDGASPLSGSVEVNTKSTTRKEFYGTRMMHALVLDQLQQEVRSVSFPSFSSAFAPPSLSFSSDAVVLGSNNSSMSGREVKKEKNHPETPERKEVTSKEEESNRSVFLPPSSSPPLCGGMFSIVSVLAKREDYALPERLRGQRERWTRKEMKKRKESTIHFVTEKDALSDRNDERTIFQCGWKAARKEVEEGETQRNGMQGEHLLTSEIVNQVARNPATTAVATPTAITIDSNRDPLPLDHHDYQHEHKKQNTERMKKEKRTATTTAPTHNSSSSSSLKAFQMFRWMEEAMLTALLPAATRSARHQGSPVLLWWPSSIDDDGGEDEEEAMREKELIGQRRKEESIRNGHQIEQKRQRWWKGWGLREDISSCQVLNTFPWPFPEEEEENTEETVNENDHLPAMSFESMDGNVMKGNSSANISTDAAEEEVNISFPPSSSSSSSPELKVLKEEKIPRKDTTARDGWQCPSLPPLMTEFMIIAHRPTPSPSSFYESPTLTFSPSPSPSPLFSSSRRLASPPALDAAPPASSLLPSSPTHSRQRSSSSSLSPSSSLCIFNDVPKRRDTVAFHSSAPLPRVSSSPTRIAEASKTPIGPDAAVSPLHASCSLPPTEIRHCHHHCNTVRNEQIKVEEEEVCHSFSIIPYIRRAPPTRYASSSSTPLIDAVLLPFLFPSSSSIPASSSLVKMERSKQVGSCRTEGLPPTSKKAEEEGNPQPIQKEDQMKPWKRGMEHCGEKEEDEDAVLIAAVHHRHYTETVYLVRLHDVKRTTGTGTRCNHHDQNTNNTHYDYNILKRNKKNTILTVMRGKIPVEPLWMTSQSTSSPPGNDRRHPYSFLSKNQIESIQQKKTCTSEWCSPSSFSSSLFLRSRRFLWLPSSVSRSYRRDARNRYDGGVGGRRISSSSKSKHFHRPARSVATKRENTKKGMTARGYSNEIRKCMHRASHRHHHHHDLFVAPLSHRVACTPFVLWWGKPEEKHEGSSIDISSLAAPPSFSSLALHSKGFLFHLSLCPSFVLPLPPIRWCDTWRRFSSPPFSFLHTSASAPSSCRSSAAKIHDKIPDGAPLPSHSHLDLSRLAPIAAPPITVELMKMAVTTTEGIGHPYLPLSPSSRTSFSSYFSSSFPGVSSQCCGGIKEEKLTPMNTSVQMGDQGRNIPRKTYRLMMELMYGEDSSKKNDEEEGEEMEEEGEEGESMLWLRGVIPYVISHSSPSHRLPSHTVANPFSLAPPSSLLPQKETKEMKEGEEVEIMSRKEQRPPTREKDTVRPTGCSAHHTNEPGIGGESRPRNGGRDTPSGSSSRFAVSNASSVLPSLLHTPWRRGERRQIMIELTDTWEEEPEERQEACNWGGSQEEDLRMEDQEKGGAEQGHANSGAPPAPATTVLLTPASPLSPLLYSVRLQLFYSFSLVVEAGCAHDHHLHCGGDRNNGASDDNNVHPVKRSRNDTFGVRNAKKEKEKEEEEVAQGEEEEVPSAVSRRSDTGMHISKEDYHIATKMGPHPITELQKEISFAPHGVNHNHKDRYENGPCRRIVPAVREVLLPQYLPAIHVPSSIHHPTSNNNATDLDNKDKEKYEDNDKQKIGVETEERGKEGQTKEHGKGFLATPPPPPCAAQVAASNPTTARTASSSSQRLYYLPDVWRTLSNSCPSVITAPFFFSAPPPPASIIRPSASMPCIRTANASIIATPPPIWTSASTDSSPPSWSSTLHRKYFFTVSYKVGVCPKSIRQPPRMSTDGDGSPRSPLSSSSLGGAAPPPILCSSLCCTTTTTTTATPSCPLSFPPSSSPSALPGVEECSGPVHRAATAAPAALVAASPLPPAPPPSDGRPPYLPRPLSFPLMVCSHAPVDLQVVLRLYIQTCPPLSSLVSSPPSFVFSLDPKSLTREDSPIPPTTRDATILIQLLLPSAHCSSPSSPSFPSSSFFTTKRRYEGTATAPALPPFHPTPHRRMTEAGGPCPRAYWKLVGPSQTYHTFSLSDGVASSSSPVKKDDGAEEEGERKDKSGGEGWQESGKGEKNTHEQQSIPRCMKEIHASFSLVPVLDFTPLPFIPTNVIQDSPSPNRNGGSGSPSPQHSPLFSSLEVPPLSGGVGGRDRVSCSFSSSSSNPHCRAAPEEDRVLPSSRHIPSHPGIRTPLPSSSSFSPAVAVRSTSKTSRCSAGSRLPSPPSSSRRLPPSHPSFSSSSSTGVCHSGISPSVRRRDPPPLVLCPPPFPRLSSEDEHLLSTTVPATETTTRREKSLLPSCTGTPRVRAAAASVSPPGGTTIRDGNWMSESRSCSGGSGGRNTNNAQRMGRGGDGGIVPHSPHVNGNIVQKSNTHQAKISEEEIESGRHEGRVKYDAECGTAMENNSTAYLSPQKLELPRLNIFYVSTLTSVPIPSPEASACAVEGDKTPVLAGKGSNHNAQLFSDQMEEEEEKEELLVPIRAEVVTYPSFVIVHP